MTLSPNKNFKRAALGCSILVFVAILTYRTPLVRQLEQATLDFRYRHFNRSQVASDQVVMIDLDEQSIKLLEPYYGRWPWPRRIYKEILEFLSLGKPSGIFFDLLFSERMLKAKDDEHLAKVSSNLGNVSHAVVLLEAAAEVRVAPLKFPKNLQRRVGVDWLRPPEMPSDSRKVYHDYLLPLPNYALSLPKMHVVNFDVDDDGVFRNAPLLFKYDNIWLPSLGLAGVLSTFREPKIEIFGKNIRILDADQKELYIPITSDGKLPLHFYQLDRRPESIPLSIVVQSALQLQRGEVGDPEDLSFNPLTLKDKIVFIGSSAAGLEDLKPTPVHPSFPGALLQATAVSNILERDHLKEPRDGFRVLFSIALLLAIYFCLFYFEGIATRLLLPLLLLAGAEFFALMMFKHANLGIGMAMPALVGIAAWLDGLASIAFVESAEKRRMKNTLSKYLSPAVTERVIQSGSNPHAEVGRQEELTIFFSDIRGFTTLSESLPPQIIVDCLNQYMGKMSDVLFEHAGTLDKFIGDSILAFWGAPLKDDLHALHAVRCAFAMKEALRHLNESWRGSLPARPEFKIGIGINTGKVIVGNIGGEKHLNYTVVGDNVNLASRMEGLTKEYKVFTVIGELTQELVKDSVICRLLDEVQVKGRTQCVKIYEPLAEKQISTATTIQELADRFHAGLLEYRNQNYANALRAFKDIDAGLPGGDAPSRLYIERCLKLMAEATGGREKLYVVSK